ncbi:hypothetical protein ACRALDRAFT_1063770 [Sodiomyces alcalophilus JCM 7366]|uniref:uncharacterized protein n=1 Tax=Sodiomyces alcalophilus JCM 7366 TaxID=591952 RepID=UPI0039B4F962
MATFIEALWDAIFTPGPAPIILRAANATFLALQVVLLVLLITTHSIHFVVLSCLCAGLWRAINWFAAEVRLVQQREREEEQRRQQGQQGRQGRQGQQGQGQEQRDGPAAAATTVTSDDDTEVETAATGAATGVSGTTATRRGGVVNRKPPSASASREVEAEKAEGAVPPVVGTVAGGAALVTDAQSVASTEDEWEKVSQNADENEKDK